MAKRTTKLDAVQKYKVKLAHQQLQSVLHDMKSGELEGQALADMKMLEEALTAVEVLILR